MSKVMSSDKHNVMSDTISNNEPVMHYKWLLYYPLNYSVIYYLNPLTCQMLSIGMMHTT